MNICDSDCAGRRSFHREPPQAPPDHARRRWALEGSATRSRSSCFRKPTCTHEAGSTRAVGRQDVGLNALRTTDLVHATADATETAEERRATVIGTATVTALGPLSAHNVRTENRYIITTFATHEPTQIGTSRVTGSRRDYRALDKCEAEPRVAPTQSAPGNPAQPE